MTVLALTLPLARRSLHRIPRRDLVLEGGDTLTLELQVVASDHPGAAAVDIAGLGPELRLLVWHAPLLWDYGRPNLGAVRWSALATVEPDTSGRAQIVVPAGTGCGWGQALGWSLQLRRLDDVSTLVCGALRLTHSGTFAAGAALLGDDASVPLGGDGSTLIGV